MNPRITDFFNTLIVRTDPAFKELVSGIAQTHSVTGSLSPKQLRIIIINANKKGMCVPPELLGEDAPPSAEPWQPDVAATSLDILAVLFAEIAKSCQKAAYRLRSLNDQTPFNDTQCEPDDEPFDSY